MIELLMQARINLANFYHEFLQLMVVYKLEMDNLKSLITSLQNQLIDKNKEIEDLKKKSNEKSS